MTKLKITILASDILENNYTDAYNCPITKALARAGRPDLYECVGIFKKESEGHSSSDELILDSREYRELSDILFGMYNYAFPEKKYPRTPVPVANFDFELNIESGEFVIDESIIQSTHVEFVEKKNED